MSHIFLGLCSFIFSLFSLSTDCIISINQHVFSFFFLFFLCQFTSAGWGHLVHFSCQLLCFSTPEIPSNPFLNFYTFYDRLYLMRHCHHTSLTSLSLKNAFLHLILWKFTIAYTKIWVPSWQFLHHLLCIHCSFLLLIYLLSNNFSLEIEYFS